MRLYLLIIINTLLMLHANAQTIETNIPTGIPRLPGPQEGQEIFIISTKNVTQFQDLLLEPLDTWLKAGNFVMRAVNNLDFSWNSTAIYPKQTADYPQLDSQRNIILKSNSTLSGLPFGSAEVLNIDGDPVRKAYKILWNIFFSESLVSDLLYHHELTWVGSQSMLRKSKGIFYRSYSYDDKNNLNRNEFFKLLSPSVVFGFSIISQRSMGLEEDQAFVYSPVVGKTRHILGSNRSDGIIGGNLSIDDTFVWSGKIQNVAAKVVAEKVILVPFPSLTKYQLQNESVAPENNNNNNQEKLLEIPTVRGKYTLSDGSSSTVLWNYASQQLRQITAWTPTTVSFVPRKVWIIELTPYDPYYLTGTEILVVDQQSMLPVYKLVYNRNGKYHKTVIGGWGVASTETNANSFPFNAFVLVVNSDASRSEILTTQYVRAFPKYEPGKEPEILTNLRSLLKPQLPEKVQDTPNKE